MLHDNACAASASATATASASPTDLKNAWTNLYRTRLPALAKARAATQPVWPVHLDHCFARIILDEAVGKGSAPWTAVVRAPAVRNMTAVQLRDAIALGEAICTGQVDLRALDARSLGVRGKRQKNVMTSVTAAGGDEVNGVKRKRTEDGVISKYFLPSPKKAKASESPAGTGSNVSMPLLDEASSADSTSPPAEAEAEALDVKESDINEALSLIANAADLTPFRKQVLTLLCFVPRGHWTSYNALSDYISRTSHKTCARAIGNAMRNNPFAPTVPCHRVLASGGKIGGFGGHWGEEGRFAGQKKRLLGREGVRFASNGRAMGRPWTGWE